MELVMFTPTGYWTEAGVKVGQLHISQFPVTSASRKAALQPVRISVGSAREPATPRSTPQSRGGAATATFWYKLFPKNFRIAKYPDRRCVS